MYHGVHELHAVVLGDVVRGGDHHTDCLAAEFARAEGGEETNAEDDRVEEVPGCGCQNEGL